MKPAIPPEPACEPLWTFRCPNFGYDIALVPHSERDRMRLKRQAKRKGKSLADFARDEILGVITLGFREEATMRTDPDEERIKEAWKEFMSEGGALFFPAEVLEKLELWAHFRGI